MEDSVMEERLRQMDKEIAEIKTNIAVMQVSLTMVRESLDSLNSNLAKILWIIGGGFLTALVGWVVSGQLTKL